MKKIFLTVLCIFMIAPLMAQWGNQYRQRNQNRCHKPRNTYRQTCQQQQYPYGAVYPQQWGNYVQPVVFPNYGGNWSPYTGYQHIPYNIQPVQNFTSGYPNGWGVYQTQQWGFQQQYGNVYYAPPRPNFAQLGMGVEMIIQSFNR